MVPFLVGFRWASLLPVLLTIRGGPSPRLVPPFAVLLLALLANLIFSLLNRPRNRVAAYSPFFLGIDLIISAMILGLSGGAQSPYYLYALGPLLTSALFFQMRGAVGAAASFSLLYLLSDSLAHRFAGPPLLENVGLITQLAGIWLIPILFAYPSILIKNVHQTSDQLAIARDRLAEQNEKLSTAHRQLKVIHDLTVLLQAAPDLISVQQRVLGAVTTGLGFRRAIVGLVDPEQQFMGNWLLFPFNSSFPPAESLRLGSENGEIFRSLLERRAYKTGIDGETLINHHALNSGLKTCQWLVQPLYLREHAVGVLLVEIDKDSGLTTQREEAVTMVANQAALALGTTILCIDRARRLAVETERNRIARDIHDTVAQSLFGIVYSLDACITMLPEKAIDVKNELTELRTLAGNAHDEVRRSIFDLWPSALTIDVFMADIKNHIEGCCRPRSFNVVLNHQGDFDSLSPGLRRTIYRMAQEGLANSARHSGADSARLCLSVTEHEVFMEISDQGCGFDPELALSHGTDREHFGLRGIQERTWALGGDCEITSKPNAGSRIMITLPFEGHYQRA